MARNSDTAAEALAETEIGEAAAGIAEPVGAPQRELAAVHHRLRRERQLSDLIIESASEGIIVVDTDLRYLVWNPAMERLNGRLASTTVGRTVFEVEPGFADHPVGRAWREAVSGRKAEIRDFRFFSQARGAEIVYDADFTPLYGEDGAIIGAIMVLRETTDRHRVEGMMRQSQKLEAVAQLTGGVAHDFNNLLTSVVGCLDMILARTGDERIVSLASTALRSVNRGTQLIQQLLAFAARQALNPVVADLNASLGEIELLLRRAVGESIAITLDTAPRLWRCPIDPAQFEAAVMNLVINARDAMPRGGRITLKTRNVATDELPAAVGVDPGEYVALVVEDTGDGMTADVLARALEPFYTTKGVGKGSGLGLSMVYGFVRQLGGDVQLESTAGAGTSVTLYLPRAQQPESPADERPADGIEPGSGTILVVEDHQDVREITVELLESLGYRVLVARDGPEAREILRRPQPIDLLFTDMVMPNGVSGVTLAREARRGRPQLQVLVTTGYAGADKPGAEEFPLIAKPFRRAELSRIVAELLGGVGGADSGR